MASAAIAKAFKLACQYHAAGQVHEAETVYRQVLQADPNHAGATHHLGLIARQTGHADQAIQLITRSIALDASVPYFHKNLGETLRLQGQCDRAAEAYQRSAQLAPMDPTAYHGLGLCYEKLDRLDEASAAYQRALQLDPRSAPTQYNLGVVFEKQGHFDAALLAFDRAVELRPDYPLARASRAIALLRKGDFQRGWAEYEWRWNLEEFIPQRPDPTKPIWDGSELEDKTLLIRAEQGLGDTFLFSRYVRLAAERIERILFEVQPGLAEVMRSLEGDLEIVERGQTLPAYDVQIPLLSLPRLLNTSLTTIPRDVPYLWAERKRVDLWRERLGGVSALKVGIIWSGSPNPAVTHRAMSLKDLAPLAGVEGVRYYSLQKGDPAGELSAPPEGLLVTDLGPELADWSDTAAVLSLLDLVISVDTAVPHLAGAMNRPTWIMLPTVADFRWMTGRDDSPWLPSVRLFRQNTRRDWKPVVNGVVDELKRRVEQLRKP